MHRTLVSTGPERPISGNSEDAGVGLRPDVDGVLKALVWFWLIDETLSANLVYQDDDNGEDHDNGDGMVMVKCLNLEKKKEENKRLKGKV